MKPCYLIRLAAVALALSMANLPAFAQRVVDDPEPWKESEVPAPAWRMERAVEFQLGVESALRYFIDPETISIGEDGVARYVFIARSSSGAVNALFEGMRCQTAEVRVYARWDPGAQQWRPASEPWQALDVRGTTRRAMQMARAGVCDGKTHNRTAAQIVHALRSGRADQFR